MNIKFGRNGQEIGEHPEEAVPALVRSGALRGDDLFWHAGLADWAEVESRWPAAQFKASGTTPKKLHRLQALLGLGAAIVTPLIIVLPSGGARGGLGAAAAAGLALLAYACYHWFRFKNTPEDEVFDDIGKHPPEEQIRMSKRAIWALAVIGPMMSIWTYHDLSTLESGAEESVRVWAPVAALYNFFGFWPAVLCWPLLCIFAIGSGFFRMAKAKSIMAAK